jgi:hypothetical protein
VVHVIIKFNRGTDAAERRKTVEFAIDRGATGVQPLLPGDSDPDAKLMFVADVSTSAEAKKLMAALGRRPEVEYAELGPQRRPRDG